MTLIDVCSFGAKGDGTTDDSAAIQAAVDALKHTVGVITLPANGSDAIGSTIWMANRARVQTARICQHASQLAK